MKPDTTIPCEFIKGGDSYLELDPRDIEQGPLEGGGTVASAHVVHASGEWITHGEALRTAEGFELVYHTRCDDEVAFEQYGCTITFKLCDLPYDPATRFTLRHVDDLQTG